MANYSKNGWTPQSQAAYSVLWKGHVNLISLLAQIETQVMFSWESQQLTFDP